MNVLNTQISAKQLKFSKCRRPHTHTHTSIIMGNNPQLLLNQILNIFIIKFYIFNAFVVRGYEGIEIFITIIIIFSIN